MTLIDFMQRMKIQNQFIKEILIEDKKQEGIDISDETINDFFAHLDKDTEFEHKLRLFKEQIIASFDKKNHIVEVLQDMEKHIEKAAETQPVATKESLIETNFNTEPNAMETKNTPIETEKIPDDKPIKPIIDLEQTDLNNPIAPQAITPNTNMFIKKQDNTPPQKDSRLEVSTKTIYIPNAKQKEPYTFVINWQDWDLSDIGTHNIEGLDGTGLAYNADNQTIEGIPLHSGDISFTIFFHFKNEIEDRPQLKRNINLYVNPDPRTLWTEHEPKPDEPFKKEHTATQRIQQGDKTLIAASRRGRSHAKDAKFRDDHFEMQYDETSQWYFITVSDGAGSAQYSREGSKIICQTIMNNLTNLDLDDIEMRTKAYVLEKTTENYKKINDYFYQYFGKALVQSVKNIVEKAEQNQHNFKDYYATILVSMCKKFDFGWLIGGVWVGDGGVGIYKADWENPKILGEADSGEYSGQTHFLTPSVWSDGEKLGKRIRFEIVPDFDVLALMTDGITDAWFHTDANLKSQTHWLDMLNDIQKTVDMEVSNENAHEQLLEWLNFWVRGEYDDRTIALLF